METRKRKIEALVETLPPVMGPVFGKDACVLAARVGMQLLHEVGVEASPLPVRCAIYNRAMAERIGNDVGRLFEPWPEDEELAAKNEGCWSVMIGWVEPGDPRAGQRFIGHVVLTTRNPDGIIDLTLDQAARPDRDIHVEPAFLPLDRQGLRALRAGEAAAAYHEQDQDTRIVYAYAPDLEQRLREAPDWSGRGFNQLVRERTISECRTSFRQKVGLAR